MRLEDVVRGKRVVVTGGAGFIGSNLAEVLTEKNKVFVFDDLSSGKEENIDGLDAELVVGSLLDLDLLKRSFKGMDYVFHLGAIASVPKSIDDPMTTNLVNQNGTLNVLAAARDCSVEKVVNISSSAVYGDSPVMPKVETMLPDPISPYAVSKLAGELYCKVFTKTYGLPTVSLRFFNVFGPKQDPSSDYAAVIPKFIEQARDGKELTIFGDGEHTRDFTYVLDAVQAMLLAASSPKCDGKVMNVARGEAMTLNRLAEIVLASFGRDVKGGVKHLPPRRGDIVHSLADISLARSLIGYEPSFSVEEGIELTIGDR
ncbi:MAG: NAD-dependent epimerase/dehydratase family protein [Euryarchaeota archaeon]|nr:NAD-dependent epimerase/dehydratase family protein [Euryarchaeota archaeon]